MDKYNRLLDFRNTNGHSCVPFNEGELGWWVNTQRQNKRKGKLLPHREALLNKADFVWAPQEFLAARRRRQAETRANAALLLSSAAGYQYGIHQVSPYSRQYHRNFVGHSPVGATYGYATNSAQGPRPLSYETRILENDVLHICFRRHRQHP